MPPPPDKEALRFYRVAEQRKLDAWLILERCERRNAAVYLAGYAVECIFKALLIMETPRNQRNEVIDSFRGVAGHDLLGLRERVAQQSAKIPHEVETDIAYVSSWSTDLRYQPGEFGHATEARRFLASMDRILEWADGRL